MVFDMDSEVNTDGFGPPGDSDVKGGDTRTKILWGTGIVILAVIILVLLHYYLGFFLIKMYDGSGGFQWVWIKVLDAMPMFMIGEGLVRYGRRASVEYLMWRGTRNGIPYLRRIFVNINSDPLKTFHIYFDEDRGVVYVISYSDQGKLIPIDWTFLSPFFKKGYVSEVMNMLKTIYKQNRGRPQKVAYESIERSMGCLKTYYPGVYRDMLSVIRKGYVQRVSTDFFPSSLFT